MQINSVSTTSYGLTPPPYIKDKINDYDTKITNFKPASPPKNNGSDTGGNVEIRKSNNQNTSTITTNSCDDAGNDYHITPYMPGCNDDGDGLTLHIHGGNDDEDWNSGSKGRL